MLRYISPDMMQMLVDSGMNDKDILDVLKDIEMWDKLGYRCNGCSDAMNELISKTNSFTTTFDDHEYKYSGDKDSEDVDKLVVKMIERMKREESDDDGDEL